MKLWHKLAITVVMLGLLGGAYWYVSNIKPAEEKKIEDTSISLFSAKSDEIKEIHIKNPKQEYTIIKINDKWGIKEFPNITYNSTKVENAVYDFTSINASRLVEEAPSDLEQYGLKSPMAELTITMNDGKVKAFQLGNKVESYYYFKDKDSPKVYVIVSSKGEALLKDLDEYRDTEISITKPEEVTGFKVVYKDGKALNITKKDANDATASMSPFAMDSPYQGSVDGEKFNAVLTALLPISATSFVSDNPLDGAKYGLDKPDFEVTVQTDKDSFTIRMSKQAVVYASVEGKPTIFTLDDAKYNAIMNIDAFSLVEKFAHIINIDNVNSVVVEGKGKKYTVNISRTVDASKPPDPTTNKMAEIAVYTINDKTAEESAFKGAYQAIIGLMVTGTATSTPQGEPDYTVTFNMRSGVSDVYRYISIDARNYAIVGSAGAKYTILKKNVDAMMDKMDKFEKDPSKKPE